MSGSVSPRVVIVMGVSGSGKTTVAVALAHRLGWPFQEGDDLHPPANVAKMHAGQPLTDDDRWPWLDRVRAWIDARLEDGGGGIVTCSALKRIYRDRLVGGRADVQLLFLTADPAVLAARLAARKGHYMPASLLQSQLDTLEPPGEDEHPLVVDVDCTPDEAVDRVVRGLVGRE